MTSAQPDRTRSFVSDSVPEQYERRLAPVIFEPWAEQLIDWVEVRSGDRVLDVACGTGVVSRAAARRAGSDGSVTGADISAAMLARGRARDAEPGSAPIEYLEASADQLPLADGSFDAVVCQQGLQFFPDKPAAVAEMQRVLAPSGRLGVAVWAADHPLLFDEFGAALKAAGAEPPFAGAFEPSTFAFSADQLVALLGGAGLQSVEVTIAEHTAVWPDAGHAAAAIAGTPFGPLVDGLDDRAREVLDRELAARFGSGEVRRVMLAVLARARVS